MPPGSALTDADIAGADTATPTFTPDADGPYVLRLEIAYGMFINKADTVIVTAWTTFERTYGGTNDDVGASVQQTADGGFVIAGTINFQSVYGDDVYLIKTDSSGSVEWEKTYGGSGMDLGLSVRQTVDGGFIVAGYTFSFGAGSCDVYLVKTDASGNIEWEKTYGGGGKDVGYSIQQSADGGFIVAGYTNSSGAVSGDVYLIKTDASGTLEWEKTYGGSEFDYGYTVQQTADGGFIIGGVTNSFGAGYDDVYLVKTDASGALEWENSFGGSLGDGCISIQQTNEGGFIVTGGTNYTVSDGDLYLVKTDASGTLQWEKIYGGTGSDQGRSVQQTGDGGFVVAGYSYSSGGGSIGISDVYLIKTDSMGNVY